MLLYLLRHGKAAERSSHESDAERRLTSEGEQEMREEAAGIRALSLDLQIIVSSPLPRALETAQIAAKGIGYPEADIRIDARLSSGELGVGTLQDLWTDLKARDQVLLVGHEPDLSELIQSLCGAVVEMKKGGLACIDTVRPEPGSGVLRWLLTPKHLRLLGATLSAPPKH